MKLLKKCVLFALVGITSLASLDTFAAGYKQNIPAWFYDIKVNVNGKKVYGSEPFIYNGIVYMPVRDVAEASGLSVQWNDATKTVTLTNLNKNLDANINQTLQTQLTNLSNQLTAAKKTLANDSISKNMDTALSANIQNQLDSATKQLTDLKIKMENDSVSNNAMKRELDALRKDLAEKNKKLEDQIFQQERDKTFGYGTTNVFTKPTTSKDQEINGLKSQIEQKDRTINDLKFQLSKSNILANTNITNNTTSSSSKNWETDLEKYLEDKFYKYSKGSTDLEFKYDVRDYSNYVRVDMNGRNFRKGSSKWDNRNSSRFEDFIKDVAKKAADESRKEVEIYVYDDDGKRVEDYKFDKRGYKTSRSSSGSSSDIDDLERDLDRNYDSYTKGNKNMRFDFTLKQKSNDDIEVNMYADFDKTDSGYWNDRNSSRFRDYIEEIADQIRSDFKEDMNFYIYDKDRDELARYEYNYNDRELKTRYEY